MLRQIKLSINSLLSLLNLKIIKLEGKNQLTYPVEATKRDIEIMKYILSPENKSNSISMVSIDRLWAVIQATKYIVNNNIEGDFVECGVWRGGCSLAVAMVLEDLKSDRKVFLFDTFEGMTEPTNYDVSHFNLVAKNKFLSSKRSGYNSWCYASIEDVKEQFKKFGLENKASFIKGDVLKTLSEESNLPKKIALLRLDTDWYESTKFEMKVLYPRLEKHGILLIDDYGHWKGSKKAIDEYFINEKPSSHPLMWKIDYTGRGIIKK